MKKVSMNLMNDKCYLQLFPASEYVYFPSTKIQSIQKAVCEIYLSYIQNTKSQVGSLSFHGCY